MLTIILFALANAFSSHHDWRASVDRRSFDGERYIEVCVGRYQQPETWTCIEVVTRKGRT